jgi:aconitate hydratase
MLRGIFTNRGVVNLLAPDIPAGATVLPDGATLPLWQAAEAYRRSGTATVIVAGERYGMGSSRDWAAKGAALLGVRAVLAVSFERIHRANLIGMGILPIRMPDGVTPKTLALTVDDRIEVHARPDRIVPRAPIALRLHRRDGRVQDLAGSLAIETTLEVKTLLDGGLLPSILAHVAEHGGRGDIAQERGARVKPEMPVSPCSDPRAR